MNYLVLDTNIYINLCLKRKNNVTAPCLISLSELLKTDQIKIVLPEIIRIEFLRNIGPEFKNSQIFLKTVINQIDKIVLPHDMPDRLRQKTTKNLMDILSKFKNINIQEQIRPILDLMEHRNTVLVPTTDALILKAFRRVVEKKAPAHNKNKKSEADCLIVESIISYFSTVDDKNKVFFITDNKSDFANPDKPEEVHLDLLPSFRDLDINYAPHLTKILKKEFEQEIDEEDIKFEQGLPLRGFSHGFGPGFGSSFSTRTSMGEEASIAVVPAPNSRYTDQSPSWPGDYGEGS
jgi:hypothetical protein